jgi:hypothetical protein
VLLYDSGILFYAFPPTRHRFAKKDNGQYTFLLPGLGFNENIIIFVAIFCAYIIIARLNKQAAVEDVAEGKQSRKI